MPHRHPVALVLYVASATIIARFAIDFFRGGFGRSQWLGSLKESIG